MSPKKVIVFFARDFLSNWFSNLGSNLQDHLRIYIVVSDQEAENVREKDPDGQIFKLSDTKYSGSLVGVSDAVLGFNQDRFLRWETTEKIEAAINPCINVAQEICNSYEVSLYIDEPVANFPNYYFNEFFSSIGARCLHFNTSWVPGYSFFCSDAAQAEPVLVNAISAGAELVADNMTKREAGKGLPFYVLSYDKFYLRAFGAVKFFLKAGVKKFLRRNDYYLLQSHSSDFFHAKCLLASLIGGYADPEALEASEVKYVVYPMHYEPENILTYFSKYHRQSEVVAQILDSLPLDYELIIKEHPSQPGALNTSLWRETIKHKRVHKVFGTSKINAVVKSSSTVVVSFGSTMVLEAALNGAKCAVFAGVHFAEAPGILKIDNVADWSKCLDIEDVPRSEILSWYGSFLDKYCFEEALMPNRQSNGTFERIIGGF